MGDIILSGGDLKFKISENCIKICPKNEKELYTDVVPLADIIKPLFRFMEECYIDKFFSEGILRLSNFEGCGALKDDMRRDCHEGFATLSASDGCHTIEMCIRMGMNPLMLCSTRDLHSYSQDTHQHHFSETPVFAGCGVRAVETNESNT